MKLQITVNGRVYEVDVEMVEEEEGPPEEYSAVAPLPVPSPASFAPSYPPPNSPDPKISRSPVMGLVIKVNVEPGQTVQPGELMMVLEAMKMETNVMAPGAVTVKTVHVKQGDSVKLNQPLIEFE